MSGPVFSIEFPASPECVGTARIFAAAVARHYGSDAMEIEDVKIALSEACTKAISHAGADSTETVAVRATVGPGMLTYEVNGHRRSELLQSARTAAESAQTEENMIALSAELIGALFPDAEFVDTDEGTFFRFSVPAPSAA